MKYFYLYYITLHTNNFLELNILLIKYFEKTDYTVISFIHFMTQNVLEFVLMIHLILHAVGNECIRCQSMHMLENNHPSGTRIFSGIIGLQNLVIMIVVGSCR